MKHLIFDLDGTLYDAKSAYAKALKSVGIQPDDEAFKQARDRVKKNLPPHHVSARNRILYLKTYLEVKGEYQPDRLLDLQTRYEKSMQEIVAAQWKTQNRASFFSSMPRAFSYSVLTNETVRMQVLKMQAMDPKAEYFTCLLTSEEVGVEKPCPKIFESILEKLGAKSSDCCMIGDSLERDIAPAMALGMKAVWTQEYPEDPPNDQLKTCGLPPGCVIIKRLEELRTIISA